MKKRQTMGKMMRDRELRERRALKEQRKDEKNLAANEPESEPGVGEVSGEAFAEPGAELPAAES